VTVAKKALAIILDGVGDRPIESLEGRTPLEAADTPNFDMLANRGICGLMDPLAPGIRVGTDVGMLALFGYNPLRVYCGRGPIEAAGVDLKLHENDVAFRANFATTTDDGRIVSRRAARIREGTAALAKALDGITLSDGTQVIFRAATEHRAVLVLRGESLSHMVTPSDPGPDMAGDYVLEIQPRLAQSAAAKKTAALATEFSLRACDILQNHPVNQERIQKGLLPANYILLRGAGVRRPMRSLAERFHIKGACVAGESTVKGIAKMTGFTVITDPAFTANLDTDIMKKAAVAVKALEEFDIVMLHFKGPDIASHDNDPSAKAKFLEGVDAACGHIMEKSSSAGDVIFALTGDHSTPCEIGEHSADPVPAVISGRGVLRDAVSSYGERACSSGGLSRLTGNQFLLSVLDLIDVTYRFGS
jgi:2,3-bisphosphoglycerate-independent phosphoglycerate mutase